MKKLLAAAAILALAACGEEAPKPAPQVAPVTPAPQVVPAPKPEAKAPEAPTRRIPTAGTASTTWRRR